MTEGLGVLVVLGGLLALDGTSLGQFMASRPLVAGILAGWVVGEPLSGLMVGVAMELLLISMFPVGGAQFPEGGPATLAGVAVAAAHPGPGGIALGVVLALLVSLLAGRSILLLRKANGWLAPDPVRGPVSPGRVVSALLAGLGLDFLRGSLLTLVGLVAGGWVARSLPEVWPLEPVSTGGLLALGAAVPAGALLCSLGRWERRGRTFLAGFLVFFLAGLLL